MLLHVPSGPTWGQKCIKKLKWVLFWGYAFGCYPKIFQKYGAFFHSANFYQKEKRLLSMENASLLQQQKRQGRHRLLFSSWIIVSLPYVLNKLSIWAGTVCLNVTRSQESIPPAYVAWRAGTTTLFLLGSLPQNRLFKNSSTVCVLKMVKKTKGTICWGPDFKFRKKWYLILKRESLFLKKEIWDSIELISR